MKYEIQEYEFGRMMIDGKAYTRDLIIYPDSLQDSWVRIEGHSLVPEDIPEVLDMRPDVLVVGTGASGLLEVPESTKEHLLSIGTELVAAPTERAANYFNRLKTEKRTVGAFHLTC